MAKPGFLKFLAPIAAVGAGLAAPELLGALGPALGGAEGAAGAADAGAFLIPGTDVPLAGASAIDLGTLPLAGATEAGGAAAAGAAPGLLGAAAPGAVDLLGQATPELGGAAAAGAAPAAPALATAAPAVSGPVSTGLAGGITPSSPLPAASFAPADLTGPPADFGPVNTLASSLSGPTSGSLSPPTSLMGAAGPAGAISFGGGPDFLIPGTDVPLGSGVGGTADTAGGGGASAGPFFAPGSDVTLPNVNVIGPYSIDTGAAAGGGIGDTLSNAAGKAGDWAASHPGALLAAGLFGSQLFQGQPQYPGATNLSNLGSSTAGEAAALQAPLNTGILPPGAQQEVDASQKAAEATIRSSYGNLGLSGSTMEADAIANAKQNAAAQQFQIANNLVKTGAQYSGLSAQDYEAVLRSQMTADQQYQAALQNFARALGGSGYTAPAYAAAASA